MEMRSGNRGRRSNSGAFAMKRARKRLRLGPDGNEGQKQGSNRKFCALKTELSTLANELKMEQEGRRQDGEP